MVSNMITITQAIIVEGKYDKIKLSGIVDALIIDVNGFHIFKDKEKVNFIKTLATTRGIIIMTDSDSAGLIIRNKINEIAKNGKVYNAYIPEIFGKEKRNPDLDPDFFFLSKIYFFRPLVVSRTIEVSANRASALGRTISWFKVSCTSHTRSLPATVPRNTQITAIMPYTISPFLPNR